MQAGACHAAGADVQHGAVARALAVPLAASGARVNSSLSAENPRRPGEGSGFPRQQTLIETTIVASYQCRRVWSLRPQRRAVIDRTSAELIIDNLQSGADSVADEEDARGGRAWGRRRALAAFEAQGPDVVSCAATAAVRAASALDKDEQARGSGLTEAAAYEDSAAAINVAAREAVAAACNVKGDRVREVHSVVHCNPSSQSERKITRCQPRCQTRPISKVGVLSAPGNHTWTPVI